MTTPRKGNISDYAVLGFGIWAGFILAILTIGFCTARDPILHTLAGMAGGLGYLWIVTCGSLMWRYRNSVRERVQSYPLDWRLKFVLFATLLALIEEAITTSMTNLAPQFGARLGEVYITASGNYLDVVLFHSVIVLIPEFIAWAWLLSRYDFSPASVFVLYGLTGTIGETLAFGPQNVAMIGFWVFVYGLMVYLPAYSIPGDRSATKPRLQHDLLAWLLPLLFTVPVVLVITKLLHHPGVHFAPIHAAH